jgi:hypothetical protein
VHYRRSNSYQLQPPLIGKSNAYWDKMRRAYAQQWPDLHAKRKAKVETAGETLRLASYSAEDVMTWIERVPADAGVVSYPPFHGAGANFIRDFAKLETMFEWVPPPFEIMGDPELEQLIDQITDRDHWLLGTNEPIPEMEQYLRGRTRTTNRGIPIYVYANDGPTRLVQPHQHTEGWPGRHLADEEIGDNPSLAVLTSGQFAALRSAYMHASQVESEPVDGLTIRQALKPLRHHHHRHDRRRDRPTADIGEQIGEHLIGKQRVALAVQHRVDRVLRHPPLTEACGRAEQIRLRRRPAQRHRPHPIRRSHTQIILPKVINPMR